MAALLSLLAIHLLHSPILAGDTDLWYHFAGGRYLFANHLLPSDSFFSFLEPSRSLIDYYWLFQAIVYRIFLSWGYAGLIGFRAVMVFALVGMVGAYLIKNGRRHHPPLVLALLIGLYLIVFLPRSMHVRPHLFTYALIAAFLLVLESSPRYSPLLVLLAILWANVHGITYPVMEVILGAYLLEMVFCYGLKGSAKPAGAVWLRAVSIALSMASVFFTPHGFRLLQVPWTSTRYASEYINELTPISPLQFSQIQVANFVPSLQTLFNLLFFLIIATAVISLYQRRLRLAHACLFLAGLSLLPRGQRFVHEFLLLALPMLAATRLVDARYLQMRRLSRSDIAVSLGIGACLGLVLTALMEITLGTAPARYPISRANLPVGVTAFLKQTDVVKQLNVGGRLLHHPNAGGYFQWELYPRYKILMDMQVPFLFSDEDMYKAQQLFSSQQVLSDFRERYEPQFMSVPLGLLERAREELNKHPEFVLVAFDDQEALYCDSARLANVAERYALRALDPLELRKHEGRIRQWVKEEKTQENIVARMQEAMRLLGTDPGCRLTNLFAFAVYFHERAFDRALVFADAIVDQYPDQSLGHYLRGLALKELRAYPQALASFKTALPAYRRPANPPEISRQQGLVYLAMGNSRAAFRELSKSVSPFSRDAAFEDLYAAAVAAERTGHHRKAEQLFSFAHQKAPVDAQERIESARNLASAGIDLDWH